MNTEHDENLPATPPGPLLDEEPSPHDTTPLQNDSANPEHVDAIPPQHLLDAAALIAPERCSVLTMQ